MPRGSVPLVSQLEARIDEAVVIARASEAGVREVGEMALDAARQARRAAEAAEASARAAVQSSNAATAPTAAVEASEPGARPAPAGAGLRITRPRPLPFEARFTSFSERADRLSARLRALQDHPSHRPTPSGGVRRS
ncbi:MAG: hypothetical protein ACJ76D_00235 [Solirubrobacterales bacterium]